MKIVTLTEQEFDYFSNKSQYNTFYQTSAYAEFMRNTENYNIHYLGFTDNNNQLIGASLMLYKTLFWGYKFAYAPRGFLFNFDDLDSLDELTKEITNLLKKQKFIFVKIDPPIVASKRDAKGNIVKFNDNVNNILGFFKNNNYEHLGFNLYNESLLPRWNVSASLNKDSRILYNNFDTKIKEKITYANNMAISVRVDETSDINNFYEFIKNSNYKRTKKYYTNLHNAFNKESKIKIFYAYLDTQKYVFNANKLYNDELEKNKALADIIQSGDKVKYNIPKAINDKVTSDKALHTYKKDVVTSTKLLKEFPDGITCGTALVLVEANGINVLLNYTDSRYVNYNISTVLYYEIMKFFGKQNYKYINLGPITGNFDPNSKYYVQLTNKIGFNSSILEYIGEFNLIVNQTMYKIYKRKYNKK